ncbi:MAG: TerB family tellurite resistance protein [Bacteroidota bacterium]
MFLNELSPEQRRALHVLARQIIDADERLTLQEVERLDEIYEESGIGAETAAAPNAAGDLNLLFPTPRDRAVVVIELLLVAYADGQLHPREEATVQRVAAQLHMDQGLWTNVLDWARRYAALASEARAFGRTREARFDD